MSSSIFYGWWITAASGFIFFITVGIGLYSAPVFLVPLQEHFGWSRAAIAGGGAVAALMAGAVSPLVGLWIDRYGSRKVMSLGVLLMGSGIALFALMESLWHLYAINLIAAIGISCAAWIPNQTLISNWFIRKRGLAMGISLTGIGLGGLAIAPLAELLIAQLGWRLAYAALASLLLPGVAVILVIVRSFPADMGLLPDGEVAASERNDGDLETSGLEVRESLRTSAFWIISLCNLLLIFGGFSIVTHLVAFLIDQGFESRRAAASLGIMIGASVIGRLLFGALADRFHKPHVMCLALLLLTAGMFFLFRIQSAGTLPAFLFSFGIAFGGGAVLIPLLVSECFGLRSFGRILGLIMVSATLGGAIGPVVTGRIYDVSGSYGLAFILHTAAFAFAAVTVYFLRAPKTGAQPVSSRS